MRFVQVYHNNWDHHANVSGRMPFQCKDVDQACWGLVQDLKSRGLFDETLVIWAASLAGRSILKAGYPIRTTAAIITLAVSPCGWPAGARSRGRSTARPDEFSYNIVKDPVHIRDFHATVLQLLGFDHQRFTYRYQGLDQKLTGVEPVTW